MNTQSDSSIAETHRFLRHAKIMDRLWRSELFQSYQQIFQGTTGLSVELNPADEELAGHGHRSENQNRFCQLLNRGEAGCEMCLLAHRCLASNENRGVKTVACVAGLQETVIPIMVGSTKIAELKTGQIFHAEPSAEEFRKVSGSLGDLEVEAGELEEAYLATPVVEKQKYHAMITLLAAFSLQLTKLANQIALSQENEGESFVEKAKDFIEENLTEVIHLDTVANEVGMSPFHFCRKFKESTGTTLTSYISKRRVQLAKEALTATDGRVTDIAFESGFQSLSQFNRCFHAITGLSPTRFRREGHATSHAA